MRPMPIPLAIAVPLVLGACVAQPPTAILPPATIAADCPEVPATAPVTASAAPAKPTAAAKATSSYHNLQASEASAVTAPGATAAYIKEVHMADDLARTALRLLVAQDGHPTDAAIAAARQSVDDLVKILENTPGGGVM
jgi:hypothetical protein